MVIDTAFILLKLSFSVRHQNLLWRFFHPPWLPQSPFQDRCLSFTSQVGERGKIKEKGKEKEINSVGLEWGTGNYFKYLIHDIDLSSLILKECQC